MRHFRPPALRRACPGPGARWLGRVLIAAGLVMVPWLFVLAAGLPSSTTAAHWSTAWVGLDAMEALGLVTTGVLLLRRDVRFRFAATAEAVLLLVDAWFDVTTAAPGLDRATAVAMAVCLEIPIALLCARLALRGLRVSTEPGGPPVSPRRDRSAGGHHNAGLPLLRAYGALPSGDPE